MRNILQLRCERFTAQTADAHSDKRQLQTRRDALFHARVAPDVQNLMRPIRCRRRGELLQYGDEWVHVPAGSAPRN